MTSDRRNDDIAVIQASTSFADKNAGIAHNPRTRHEFSISRHFAGSGPEIKRGCGMRVKDASKVVSVLELRRLLYDLRDHTVGVCVRFRRLGEMWKPNFMNIVDLNDRGVIFNDSTTNEFVFVMDLADIMQFELDYRFQVYEPYYHYEVTPWD